MPHPTSPDCNSSLGITHEAYRQRPSVPKQSHNPLVRWASTLPRLPVHSSETAATEPLLFVSLGVDYLILWFRQIYPRVTQD
jgi:hypothetical protein